MHFSPEEIHLRPNLTTSRWMDLENLINNGKVIVSSSKGGGDQMTAICRLLQEGHGGAVMRWAVQAREDHQHSSLQLVLQGLPCPASYLQTSPIFQLDSCLAKRLAQFPLRCRMEESGPARGPEPTLFACQPQLAEKALSENPELIIPGERLHHLFKYGQFLVVVVKKLSEQTVFWIHIH